MGKEQTATMNHSSNLTDNLPTQTDSGVEIDEYQPGDIVDRALIKGIPHNKLELVPVVYVAGDMFIFEGIDKDGRLIFEGL